MSSIRLGQGGGYSRIPSAIPESNRKMASSLDEVLEKWDDRDIIKYQAPRETNPSGSYYSDSQQPEGLLESGRRFFAHLADPEAQALHRDGLSAVVKDLKNESAFPFKGVLVEKSFSLRKTLGQPLSVGALKQSIKQATPESTPQGASEATPQSSTEKNSSPSPFSVFGKARNIKNRESALQIVAKEVRRSLSFSERSGYQQIPEDHDSKKSAQQSPTKQRTSSFPYQASPFHDGNRKPLTAEDFPPIK